MCTLFCEWIKYGLTLEDQLSGTDAYLLIFVQKNHIEC